MGPRSAPIAASSGSNSKAPGFAGGYLLLDRLRNQTKRRSIKAELAAAFPGVQFEGRVAQVEHHLAHLASAFLVSPFKEACVASIDGFGDFSSAAWGVGRETSIDIEGRVHFPHSLGVFYQVASRSVLEFDLARVSGGLKGS